MGNNEKEREKEQKRRQIVNSQTRLAIVSFYFTEKILFFLISHKIQ